MTITILDITVIPAMAEIGVEMLEEMRAGVTEAVEMAEEVGANKKQDYLSKTLM